MQILNQIVQTIRSRAPRRKDALEVLGVVAFAVFGWSIRGFLFKVPAFTLYFGLGANLAILSYMWAFALLESVLVAAALVVLAILLPARWLKDGFAYKGFVIVLVATASMIAFDAYYKVEYFKDMMAGNDSSIPPFLIGAAGFAILLGLLLWLVGAHPRVRRVVQFVVDQLSVFTYIYVPLGLIGLLVVIIRNLL